MPAPPKLLLRPSKTAYSAGISSPVAATAIEGGPPRFRADFVGTPHMVSVRFQLGPDEFDYLMAFYRTSIAQGSLPFYVDLILASHDIASYLCQIQPNTFRISGTEGLTYYVTMTLIAQVPVVDPAGDVNIIGLFTPQADITTDIITPSTP